MSLPEIPREKGSPVLELPLMKEGPDDFFPAVRLKTHWDPTAILRHTLPAGYVGQSTDPRPWTRICMEYTTAGEQDTAPVINDSVVMPMGGQFYPASRYSAAIDNESKLRWLDRKLGTCEEDQWEPTARSDMYDARILIPERTAPSDPSKIQEMAYPKALLRSGPYDCRANDDAEAIRMTSDYIFNNATKQDRYKLMNKPTKPEGSSLPLKASPESLRPDLLLNAGSSVHADADANAKPVTYLIGSTLNPVHISGRQGGGNPNDLSSVKNNSDKNRASTLPWNPPGVKVGAYTGDPMMTVPFSDNSPYAPF
jgi:hypothetical protein